MMPSESRPHRCGNFFSWLQLPRGRALIAASCALIAVFASVELAQGGAQLIPEHQHRLGSCPNGAACVWDCGGAQCGLGPGHDTCEEDAECSSLFCSFGPVCDDGQSRVGCDLPVIDAFPAHLVVRVEENDDLCAPLGQGCNQTSSDDCGSIVTVGLRGRKQDGSATEFVIQKDINLCDTGVQPCAQDDDRDCNQCLDGFTDPFSCPRPNPVFLCHGTGGTDISDFDLDSGGELSDWISAMQPLEFIRSDLPLDLQAGIPVIVNGAQTSGRFCSGPNPTECTGDFSCTPPEVCVPQAEFCVTMALLKGRCIGGGDDGELCVDDAECDTANCAIDGVFDLSSLVSDDQDLVIDNMGTCADFACGDGIRDALEECDDSNVTPGDGCDASCAIEPCFACTSPLGEESTCTQITTCSLVGDGCCPAGCDQSSDADCASTPTNTPSTTPSETPTDTPTEAPVETPTETPAVGECPSTRDASCSAGFGKARLLVRDEAGKEKLVAKLLRGPQLDQGDMGNPLDPAGTVFSLCIYDDGGNQVGDSIIVDRAGQNCAANPCWKSTSNGYKYVDPNSTEDGVFKIRFKGGISGKSKAILNGRGPNLPDGIPAALQNSANATFQLRASDGQCLTATVAAIKQGANIFKAK